MTAVYLNGNEQVKSCSFGYKQIQMNRLNTKQKLSQAKWSAAYSTILEHEGISYLAAMACLEAAGIPPLNANNKYLNNLNEIINGNKDCSVPEWMIQWMCSTGEMRNHKAIACHIDGNHKHPYEIYSLFQRLGKERRNGLIYLTLDNLCIKVIPAADVLVSNFRNTPHVPDQSRNTHTFLRVHG